jgi:putative effector of murein hydrolase
VNCTYSHLDSPSPDLKQILKVILTVSVGFVFTMLTTTFSVVALRKAQGTYIEGGSAAKASTGPSAKPFSEASWGVFSKGSVLLGAASIWATRTGNAYANPIQTAFLSVLTLACYIWSANLPSGFVNVVHPLATSSVLVLAFIRGLAQVTDREYINVLKTYRVASLSPMKAGAGDVLLYLLGPSVVAFAVSVYSRRELLKRNLLAVLTAMFMSSAGSLFATAFFVRAISLGVGTGAMIRLSVLSRNITTALAMVITSLVGGDISIAASVVCLTGIIGGTYGKPLLDLMGIKDPICRGLGIGSSAQGLGVAAIANEPDAFPFAAIAMVLTAIAATSLTSIPAFKDALIKAATGGEPVKAAAAAAASAAAKVAGAASAATP